MPFDLTAADAQFGSILADLDDGTATKVTLADGQVVQANRVTMRETDLQMVQSAVRRDLKLTLAVQLSALTTEPSQGDTVTHQGTTRRILDISLGPLGQDLRLHLGDEFSRG